MNKTTHRQKMTTQDMSSSMQQCIADCTECHDSCTETLAYCLRMGGKHSEASHIIGLVDCAEACASSADFMLRGSPLHPSVCGVCADACERCAQSCEQFGEDEQMRACAEVCRRCGDSCREMSTMRM